MREQSRTVNSLRNITYGFGAQLVNGILFFISRFIFIRILGEEILGISSLFTNILSVLSIAELGISNAITYLLYKPLAEKDNEKVSALLGYYRKIYNIIALVVLILGLGLLPFLNYLINLNTAVEHVHLYYVLVLLNSVVSYLLVSRSAIIYADQKSYLLQIYQSIFNFANIIFSILFLFLTKSYTVYLILQIIFTLLNNLFAAYRARKLYPDLDFSQKLKKEEKQAVKTNIKSMFIYKVGGVVLNNTDNIIISILVGTLSVGYYSNYLMIIMMLNTFMNILFSSFTASLGNLSATESNQKKYEIYKKLNFVSNFLLFVLVPSLLFLMNDFVTLWIGEKFVLSNAVVIVIVLNFYMSNALRMVGLYRDVTGLFNEVKYVFLITTILNIILSILLGYVWGLFGILLATAIARLVTNFWYEPVQLFKKVFDQNYLHYWKDKLSWLLLFFANLPILYGVCTLMPGSGVFTFLGKGIICVAETTLVYLLMFYHSEECQYYKRFILKKKRRA